MPKVTQTLNKGAQFMTLHKTKEDLTETHKKQLDEMRGGYASELTVTLELLASMMKKAEDTLVS
jgi:hypothetical protein